MNGAGQPGFRSWCSNTQLNDLGQVSQSLCSLVSSLGYNIGSNYLIALLKEFSKWAAVKFSELGTQSIMFYLYMYVSNNLHITPVTGTLGAGGRDFLPSRKLDQLENRSRLGTDAEGWRLLLWQVKGRARGGSRVSGGLEITKPTEVFSLCSSEEMLWEWKILLTEPTFQSSATYTVVISYHIPRKRRMAWSRTNWDYLILLLL